MSDELQEPAEETGAVFKPLKAATTRTESVDPIGSTAGEADGAVFKPLQASSTRTEMAGPDDAIPLVVVDDGAQEEDELDVSLSELKGEVRSLRSRNQILRTERTSIAGRKYALEVVVESLREKIEEIAQLAEDLDAPGEVGEALKAIKDILGDARRIASSKAVLEEDLEAARAKALQERQDFEQKLFDLNQQVIGYRSENETLRAQVSRLERDRMSQQDQLAQLEAQASDTSQLREIEQALEEAVAHAEASSAKTAEVEALLHDAQTDLAAAEARQRNAEAEVERARSELDAQHTAAAASTVRMQAIEDRAEAEKAEVAALRERVGELAEEAGKQTALVEEQKKALIEVKPIVEDWGRLDKENNRLSRLVGEARARGRVNVQELMARAALLKRLEKLTAD